MGFMAEKEQEYWESILKKAKLGMNRGMEGLLYIGMFFDINLPCSAECRRIPWEYNRKIQNSLRGPLWTTEDQETQ